MVVAVVVDLRQGRFMADPNVSQVLHAGSHQRAGGRVAVFERLEHRHARVSSDVIVRAPRTQVVGLPPTDAPAP